MNRPTAETVAALKFDDSFGNTLSCDEFESNLFGRPMTMVDGASYLLHLFRESPRSGAQSQDRN